MPLLFSFPLFFLSFFYASTVIDSFSFVWKTHLETSITRHKAHIMKLELILRLLDNDELSPEQVNDVKDFLEDYVDRNQVCTASYSSLYLFHCCCKQ
jgi:CCR4-NOT transcriptional regulation complex NOT5 subunit